MASGARPDRRPAAPWLLVAVPTALILAPQFIGVLRQADIIAGHAFPSFKSVKQGVVDALAAAHPPPQRFPDPDTA